MDKKLRRVKVMTPEGEKYLMYRPISDIPKDCIICDSDCPYGKVCGELPDPRNPEDKDSCFTDFCNEIGENNEKNGEESIEMSTYIPCDGELENFFSDKENVLQIIIGKDPVFKLTDIIDSCCPSMCDYYDKSHQDCTFENKMCIFRPLFLGTNKLKKKNKKNEEDKDK